jgi:hypothetical protein
MARSKEETETVTALFEDMKWHGPNDPLLVSSDGAAEISRLSRFRVARQRCLADRMRHLAAKVAEDIWPEFKVRPRGLSGAEPGDCASPTMTANTTAGSLASRTTSKLYRPLPLPCNASTGHLNTNLLKKIVRRETSPPQHHPECVWRASRRRRAHASIKGHRVRASADSCHQKRTRSKIRGPGRLQSKTSKDAPPGETIQQHSNLSFDRLPLMRR